MAARQILALVVGVRVPARQSLVPARFGAQASVLLPRMVVSVDWQPCSSSAVRAYRYRDGVLDIVFVDGDAYYSYPCSEHLFEEFRLAPSKGRFVNGVLKPHAEAQGWRSAPRPLDP